MNKQKILAVIIVVLTPFITIAMKKNNSEILYQAIINNIHTPNKDFHRAFTLSLTYEDRGCELFQKLDAVGMLAHALLNMYNHNPNAYTQTIATYLKPYLKENDHNNKRTICFIDNPDSLKEYTQAFDAKLSPQPVELNLSLRFQEACSPTANDDDVVVENKDLEDNQQEILENHLKELENKSCIIN